MVCYSPYSSITLNRNEYSFTVHLDLSHEPGCYDLPTGIKANLTLGSSVFKNSIVVLFGEFNYSTVKELVLTFTAADLNLPIDQFTTEDFATLTLSSYTLSTTVELMVFDDEVLDMSTCFSSLGIILESDYFILSATSGTCNRQIQSQLTGV